MIEAAMYLALGALLAGLFALLVFPALNARAERLARRRVEALFPMSIAELTAEKDHLRAEFAVVQRRLEREAEEARSDRGAEMEELGRRALRIEALTGDVAVRDATIAVTEGERDAARKSLAETQATLALTQGSLEETGARLAALVAAHQEAQDALATSRAEAAATAARLAVVEAERDEARGQAAARATEAVARSAEIAARSAEVAELTRRHDLALQEIDARRIAVSDLETRLGTEAARVAEGERTLAAHREELDRERERHAGLAARLAETEARALTAVREAQVAPGEGALLADNADLRRRIVGLADQFLADADRSA